MIEIPEEKLLADICDLLMNELPKYLLELEELSKDSVQLPPLRFAGQEEDLPVGVPYAVVSVEEGSYSRKDRVIQCIILKTRIALKLIHKQYFLKYCHTIKQMITDKLESYLITDIVQDMNSETIEISLKKCNLLISFFNNWCYNNSTLNR